MALNNNGKPLDVNNPTEMYRAKLALKHNLYTYVSTYKYARDYTSDDDYKINAGVIGGGQAQDWVTPRIIAIDLTVFGCTVISALYLFEPWKYFKKEKQE